jgi:DNA-binding transcriptional MocR family regulator
MTLFKQDYLLYLEWAHLTAKARHVLHVLTDFDNKVKGCFPKETTIARFTGYSVSTVKLALAELEESGLIKIHRRPRGSKDGNWYELLFLQKNFTPTLPGDHDDPEEDTGYDPAEDYEDADDVTRRETAAADYTRRALKRGRGPGAGRRS